MKDHKKPCVESWLPLDLVADILSRLPVKSLIRFHCVCKPWRFLINDANFAKEQHNRAAPALISPYDIEDGRLTLYDFDGPECDIKERMPQVEFKELAACLKLSNSVNGLICGYDHHVIYRQKYCLLNPSTHTLVQVPGPDLSQDVCKITLGLGFDGSTGNYKLVLLSSTYVLPEVGSCFVLTVGCDNKWRYVGDAPSSFPRWQPFFVGGVINWITGLGKDEKMAILAFHTKDEKFQLIPTPVSVLPTYRLHLSSCEEHLWLSGSNERCLSIWKLNDYSSQKWTREYQLSYSLDYQPKLFFPILVAVLKDGKYVLNCMDFFADCQFNAVIFDNLTKSFKYYDASSELLALYEESLVCPRYLLGLKKVV